MRNECTTQSNDLCVCMVLWTQIGERRDKAIDDLRDQLAAKKRSEVVGEKQEQNFWECSGFKIVASMSMLILVIFSKR